MKLLPLRSLTITGLVERSATYGTILASEDRSKELRQRRLSAAGVELRVFISIPHPGHQLVCK